MMLCALATIGSPRARPPRGVLSVVMLVTGLAGLPGLTEVAPAAAAEPPARVQADPDLDNFLRESRALYDTLHRRTVHATTSLFTEEGILLDNVDVAVALHLQSIREIEAFRTHRREVLEGAPVLFAPLDTLEVRNLTGLAAVLSLLGAVHESLSYRERAIGVAEDALGRVDAALRQRVLPQFHPLFHEIRRDLRDALAEAHLWMGFDRAAAGDGSQARIHYITALALADTPEDRVAALALIADLDADAPF